MTRVSVVIPTKDRPETVTRAVNSVLSQSYSNLEVIVVVDGDDPKTVASLRTIPDPRLSVVVNPISMGAELARNIGAQAGIGQWIAFLDDDDEWSDKKIEEQLKFATSDNVIVTCLTEVTTQDGSSIRPKTIYDNNIPFSEWLFDRRSLTGGDSFVQTSSLLISRNLFKKILFMECVEHDEWDLLLRAINFGAHLITVPKVLVTYYVNEQATTISSNHKVDKELLWLDNVRQFITPRAYSGFCLTVVSHRARKTPRFRLFTSLLFRAFRYGNPTVTQLIIYFSIWALPNSFARKIRSLLGRGTARKIENQDKAAREARPT